MSSKHQLSGDEGPDDEEQIRPKRQRRVVKQKIDAFDRFAIDVETAVDRAVGNEGGTYRRAAILSIQFDNVDFEVDRLRDELLNVLSDAYGFHNETYIIATNVNYVDAAIALEDRLIQFRRKYETRGIQGAKGALLIIHYSGHAYRSKDKLHVFGRPNARGNPMAPCLDWSEIAHSMTGPVATADQYLAIMDCCDSAAAHVGHRIELMGARSWIGTAESEPEWCFTKALTHQLKMAAGESISAVRLVSAIQHDAQMDNMDRAMPMHRLARDDRPSAVFCDVRRTAGASRRGVVPIRSADVLIEVRVRDEKSVPSADDWARWLASSVPREVAKIEILGRHLSRSVTLDISLPFELWCVLPARPAYWFRDHLQPSPRTIPPPSPRAILPPPPPTGWGAGLPPPTRPNQKENVPPRQSGSSPAANK